MPDLTSTPRAKEPLSGKVALITGSTKGIGLAIAKSLSALGARVAISSRSADAVASALKQFPPSSNAIGATCDVRVWEQVERLVNEVAEKAGGLDILINNAGIGAFKHVSELTPDTWDAVIGTNLSGVFYASRAAIPHFRQRGSGAIINISSLAGKNAFVGGTAYNASKFGLEGLSEAMMLELRHENIRVAYVMPGSVKTEFAGRTPDASDDWKLTSEDVAEMVVGILLQDPRALASRIELRPFKPPKRQ